MKTIERQILEYLSQTNDWISAPVLANIFNISTRTLRRYITRINEDDVFVQSSKAGYRLSDNIDIIELEHDSTSLPPLTRRKTILQMLLAENESIDVFDLSESLFISESTLLSDITYIKKHLLESSDQIKIKNNCIYFEAPETSKRRIISSLFYEESNDNFFDIRYIQRNLDNDNVDLIKSVVKESLYDNDIHLNEYTLNSILIHLSISIGRIEDKNYIESDTGESPVDEKEYQVAEDIIKRLESTLMISIPIDETYYLAALLASKSINVNYSIDNILDLTKYVDIKYFNLTRHLIQRVFEVHYVDLNDNEFILKFTVHLRNLIKRLKQNTKIQNPLTSDIKTSYPMIYNLSVFIAYEIEKEVNYRISEDEITYLAFHIGAFFERKKLLENSISTIIISPDYYGMHAELIERIKSEFSNSIDIIHVFTELNSAINDIESDLVISTIPLELNQPYLKISPFLKQEDIGRIFNEVVKIRSDRNTEKVKNYLLNYLSSDFFEISEQRTQKNSLIDKLANKFLNEEIIDDEYVESIHLRERLSSTYFSANVAMPHALKPSATKSALSIYINKQGVEWDSENTANLVVLFVLSKEDGYSFNHVFDGLIDLLTNPSFVNKLISVNNFQEFKEIISNI